ncbi:phosphoribosylglycinamide formyltransferase [Endomicrobiia bacterium]|uniref:Phosphoribosylglycinamide formyltransferase n=1 Tax=Endomicrobium trichonymphae TaxID=1408204 RepID=B1GYX7_ENDTX|nr:phosphoribosylglycinamide formyltransferase [Candidatus Endomicrobium trichonymphae]GHT04745.1 phosphoribosylglycinamide formyltransferase [Endomicrobiia bacterium]BAG14220.1 phosphoribosylglycinamide formyltransferase [Candidatus Endomicrobium trichonymphae]GHT12033.1 phosphoribosylglycinamide formyltransferase [Endomicrobiia bacterium]GHT15109.1 phosphoribosylglycinamide formyltransferase [Endomicrobiia bacterium]GHT20900.1 phosphoribosylglycinamide formyltransferase [Endomicrobiia bacter
MKERKNRGYIVKRLAILVSGSGSNMQSIADSTNRGILKGLAAIVLVISNNPNAYALRRAENENIKAVCIERKDFEDEKSFNGAILEELQNTKVDIVCLAGYMRMIGQEIMDVYRGRMLNIHPALLPKFGGKGMYGYHVHEAVVKAGEKKSGVTVHFVEEEYDTGKIVIQREVEVFKSDTPQDVAKKVLAVEHRIYPEAIKKVVENEL